MCSMYFIILNAINKNLKLLSAFEYSSVSRRFQKWFADTMIRHHTSLWNEIVKTLHFYILTFGIGFPSITLDESFMPFLVACILEWPLNGSIIFISQHLYRISYTTSLQITTYWCNLLNETVPNKVNIVADISSSLIK